MLNKGIRVNLGGTEELLEVQGEDPIIYTTKMGLGRRYVFTGPLSLAKILQTVSEKSNQETPSTSLHCIILYYFVLF